MGEICSQTKSYPPLIKQKSISTLPHIMIILRLTPPRPPWKSLLPLIPSYLVCLLDFFLWYKHHFPEIGNWDKLGDSSSSTASLALRFPRVWVRTRSINSALLPLILRSFCFRYIFSSFLVRAFTSFTCFIYHTLNLYCFLNFNSSVFHSAKLWCHVC